MKKIVFISNHLSGGGAERVLTSLANFFDESGFGVSIIAFDAKERYPINKNIAISEIGDSSSLIKQSRAIRRELKLSNPDIVISFEFFVNLATIIAARGLKLKKIISERNDPARVGTGLGKTQLRNWLYLYCDKLVCQTQDAMDYFPDAVRSHTVVIPNPIKNGLPLPYEGKRKHTIVNFCRLNEQKNLKLLIDAFADFQKDFSDYNLEIYGDGPEKEYIENYIKNSRLNQSVFLFPNTSDVHSKVVDCAMFVSSSDYEGLSNSMLEAMAIGLPTICTDCPCGGARMVIKNGKNGLLVPVRDRASMKDAMKRIAESDVFSCSLSKQASKVREELSIEKIAELWEKLF